MKKQLSLILAVVMLAGAVTFATPSAANEYSKYDVSKYDAGIYTSPTFWEGNVVINECVYPIKDAEGELHPFKLLYPATKILYVKNYSLRFKFTEGEDWELNEDGDLVILEDGRIPTVDYEYLHRSDSGGEYQHLDEPGIEPGSETTAFLTQFICVTYVHDDDDYYDDARPAAMGPSLPRTMSKLENGEKLKIINVGDSFTGGAGPKYVPAFPRMTADGLAVKFENKNIVVSARGVGGSTSDPYDENGIPYDLHDNTFYAFNDPDLIIMCYGANDSNYKGYGLSDDDFRRNMKMQIEYFKSQVPDVEILLVSTTHSDYLLWHKERYLAHDAILHELADEYDGVGVCDILALQQPMYDRGKTYDDFRADIVHPNDFTTRIIAQAIIDCLRYDPPEHIYLEPVEKDGNYEYTCLLCGEVFTELVTDAGPTVRPTGDADKNGRLNSADVIKIMRRLVGYRDSDYDSVYADFNGNGKVNSRDVMLLMRHLVGGTLPPNAFG